MSCVQISHQVEECIAFRAHQHFQVGLIQPASVSVYSYYKIGVSPCPFLSLMSPPGPTKSVCLVCAHLHSLCLLLSMCPITSLMTVTPLPPCPQAPHVAVFPYFPIHAPMSPHTSPCPCPRFGDPLPSRPPLSLCDLLCVPSCPRVPTDDRCTRFYHPDKDGGQLRKICHGDVCRCAEGDMGTQGRGDRECPLPYVSCQPSSQSPNTSVSPCPSPILLYVSMCWDVTAMMGRVTVVMGHAIAMIGHIIVMTGNVIALSLCTYRKLLHTTEEGQSHHSQRAHRSCLQARGGLW